MRSLLTSLVAASLTLAIVCVQASACDRVVTTNGTYISNGRVANNGTFVSNNNRATPQVTVNVSVYVNGKKVTSGTNGRPGPINITNNGLTNGGNGLTNAGRNGLTNGGNGLTNAGRNGLTNGGNGVITVNGGNMANINRNLRNIAR